MSGLPRNSRVPIALFLLAWAILVGSDFGVLLEIPYMPWRYGLGLLGRVIMLAALCWIALSYRATRKTATLMLAAIVVLALLVISEIPAIARLIQETLGFTPQQFARVVQSPMGDTFVMLIMLMLNLLVLRSGQATQRAERNERWVRRIFDHSNDAILVVDDTANRVIDANPTACRMLEYDLDALLAAPVSAVFPDEPAALKRFAAAVALDGGRRTGELNCRTRTGKLIPVEVSASLLDHSGRSGVIAIIRDVSQRKGAEANLRDSLERYKVLVEATRVIPWEVDLATWRFTYVGPQAVQVFGYPPEAWYAPNFWTDHLHPDDRDAALHSCQQCVARGEDHELEYRMLTAGGESRWIRDIVSLVRDGSTPSMLRGVFIDVTDQKQAEQALRESESLRRSIMENSPDYVAMLDLEGVVLFINQTGPHLKQADVIGHTIYRHAPAEYHDAIRECFRRVVETREADHVESEYRAPNGDVGVFSCRVGPFVQDGKVVAVILNASNVTERKKTEAALRDSERRLELAVWGGDLGLWDWDIQTGDVYFNSQWFEMLGYEPGELESHVSIWERLVHPDDRDRVIAEAKRHLKGETPAYLSEHRLRTKSGEWKWILDRGKVVARDISGRPLRAAGTQADIDQRTRAEEALRHSESLRRSITQSSPDHIMLVEADGTIQFINHTIPEYTVETVIGKKLYDFLHPEFHALVADCLARVRETQEPGSYEVEHVAPGGAVRFFETRVAPLVNDGKVVALTLHSTDITPRRRVEQERLALETRILNAEKLESLGVMAGGVAHDFNNLLTGILGQANLALADLPKASPVRAGLESIETAARRASELCRQMLVFAGRERFSVEVLELNSVVTEMAELLKAVIPKATRLNFELSDPSPSVEADPVQIGRIVVNLITNASDALEDREGSGTITIRTGTRAFDTSELAEVVTEETLAPGTYAFLEVVDTGCGMDDDTRKRVFDPFFSTKFAGRGLGLAAVLGIVRGHRGGIQITSQPGAGTTVRVLLRPSARTQPLRKPTLPRLSRPKTGTILVVDDEEVVRKVARTALERAGFCVITANDGEEGIAVFRGRPQEISAVLLDVTMPKLDGRQTLDALRRIRVDVPVILSSGYDHLNGGGSEPDSRITDFIQKPYRPHILVEKLNTLLSSVN